MPPGSFVGKGGLPSSPTVQMLPSKAREAASRLRNYVQEARHRREQRVIHGDDPGFIYAKGIERDR